MIYGISGMRGIVNQNESILNESDVVSPTDVLRYIKCIEKIIGDDYTIIRHPKGLQIGVPDSNGGYNFNNLEILKKIMDEYNI